MANNVVLKTIELTETWQPLSPGSLVATVTLSCPAGNAGPASIRTPAGAEASLDPGEWHTLHRVDLNRIEASGNVGDTLSVVGGTW